VRGIARRAFALHVRRATAESICMATASELVWDWPFMISAEENSSSDGKNAHKRGR
jgi:hypothetical protein